MSVVSEIITQDQIQDLWGCGFTIVSRQRHPDPFHVPQEMVPQGRSYQWWHLVHDKFHFHRDDGSNSSGWSAVPASRHDGYFMPFGHTGDIEVSGLGLFEKSKVEVDQERAKQKVDALKPMQDWAEKFGQFTGHALVVDGDGNTQWSSGEFVAPETKTIDTTTAIPRDMTPHIATIFTERDRLVDCYLACDDEIKMVRQSFETHMLEHPDAPRWPTLHAILLPIAIENVRKSLKQETKT